MDLEEKFKKISSASGPGDELTLETTEDEEADVFSGTTVDFSHGDVDAFKPVEHSIDTFIEGFHRGAEQAYTEYRGSMDIRVDLANKLSDFTGASIDAENHLIITPGTQGALFLAAGSTITKGTKVAIVTPDYFANRRIVEFLHGEVVPIAMDYLSTDSHTGLDLTQLEEAFKTGVEVFIFSNPNNPTGVVYTLDEIKEIAQLAEQYGVFVIVDELYSRQIFDSRPFTHLCAQNIINSENIMTIMGPSKTESLSGFRLGVAFGSAKIIRRMEDLQAIVSIRASGYNQAVLKTWFNEPEGWLERRIGQHQRIRDDLVKQIREVDGFNVRLTEGGSYLFPKVPELSIAMDEFIKRLRMEAGIIVTPGRLFGDHSTDSFRINFSQDHSLAVESMERIIRMVEQYRM